jgi:hypothetical protein
MFDIQAPSFSQPLGMRRQSVIKATAFLRLLVLGTGLAVAFLMLVSGVLPVKVGARGSHGTSLKAAADNPGWILSADFGLAGCQNEDDDSDFIPLSFAYFPETAPAFDLIWSPYRIEWSGLREPFCPKRYLRCRVLLI